MVLGPESPFSLDSGLNGWIMQQDFVEANAKKILKRKWVKSRMSTSASSLKCTFFAQRRSYDLKYSRDSN